MSNWEADGQHMLLVVFAFLNFIACRRRLLRKEYLTTAYVIRSPFLARIVPSFLRSFPPEASLIPDRRFEHDLFSAGGEFSSLSCPETSEVRAGSLKTDHVFNGRPFDRLAGADPERY